MAKALEIMREEDGCALEGHKSANSGLTGRQAEEPPACLSWPPVAVPICLVVFCASLAFGGWMVWGRHPLGINPKGLRITGAIVYQHLTGRHAGQVNEILVKVETENGLSKEFAAASEFLLTSSRLDFFPISTKLETVRTWPTSIPRTRTETAHWKAALSLQSLQPCEGQLGRVSFVRKAMDVLLGSLCGASAPLDGTLWAPEFISGSSSRGRLFAPPDTTRTFQAPSAFGAWFGAPAAGAVGADAQLGQWLAPSLLLERLHQGRLPLVLRSDQQKLVASAAKANRSEVLARYMGGEPDGVEVVSAFDAIVPLFRFVRELSAAGIPTILEVDEFFSKTEAQTFTLWPAEAQRGEHAPSAQFQASLVHAATGSAERRVGPRFLARCLLLLERWHWDFNKTALGKSSNNVDAAKWLLGVYRKTNDHELLDDLKRSKLNVWLGGTMDMDWNIPEGKFTLLRGQKGFQLVSPLEEN